MNPSSPPAASAPAEPHCLLTLVLPLALEEEVLDLLHAQAGLLQGFSIFHGQGVGAGVPLTTVMEQVQGRARRVLVQAALRQEDVAPLLTALRQALPSPEVTYWAVPLALSGSLA